MLISKVKTKSGIYVVTQYNDGAVMIEPETGERRYYKDRRKASEELHKIIDHAKSIKLI